MSSSNLSTRRRAPRFHHCSRRLHHHTAAAWGTWSLTGSSTCGTPSVNGAWCIRVLGVVTVNIPRGTRPSACLRGTAVACPCSRRASLCGRRDRPSRTIRARTACTLTQGSQLRLHCSEPASQRRRKPASQPASHTRTQHGCGNHGVTCEMPRVLCCAYLPAGHSEHCCCDVRRVPLPQRPAGHAYFTPDTQ